MESLLQYNLNGELIKEWRNANEVAKILVNDSNIRSNSVKNIAKRIRMCCRGEAVTRYGYVWKYKEC